MIELTPLNIDIASLVERLGKDGVIIDAEMSEHTSFRAGGKADLLVLPQTEEDVAFLIKTFKTQGIPFYIMGNGSNLLVRDKGYRGAIIKLAKNFSRCLLVDDILECQSGVLLSRIAKIALENHLTGFEFASGIPGTLGGAVTMNAGAYDGELKDVLLSARCIDADGNFVELVNGRLELGYRTSAVQKKGLIVLSGKLKLNSSSFEPIKEKMDHFDSLRKSKQPLHLPSAGSTFKRPTGYFAGKLIQDCDLKGYRVGGAQVSEKHCGFIVNVDHATAQDIIDLIDHVVDTVKERFQVTLEPEVKIIGEQ